MERRYQLAPGLDGVLASQQVTQQRQAQEMGVLSKIIALDQAQKQAAMQQAQAAEMRPLQMEALRSKIAESNAGVLQKQQQSQARGALAGLLATGGYQGAQQAPTAVAQSDADAIRMLQAAGDTPMGVNVPNQRNVRALTAMAFPAEFGKAQAAALFPKPVAPPAPSGITKLMQERDALPAGHPARFVLDQAIAKQTTHAPGVNVNMKQESEFGKAVGKEFGEIYTGAIKAEMNAPRTIANYDRLANLLGQVNTGKFQGTIVDLKAAAKAGGIDLTAMGIPDDVAPAQASRQITNMLALELRNPAGGAGMPGALSDKDREFLVQSMPGIENDPNAVKQMVSYRKLLAKRDQEVGKLARSYRAKNGTFDEGFFDELRQFSEANPLFQQTTPTAPSAGGGVRRYNPATGKIE